MMARLRAAPFGVIVVVVVVLLLPCAVLANVKCSQGMTFTATSSCGDPLPAFMNTTARSFDGEGPRGAPSACSKKGLAAAGCRSYEVEYADRFWTSNGVSPLPAGCKVTVSIQGCAPAGCEQGAYCTELKKIWNNTGQAYVYEPSTAICACTPGLPVDDAPGTTSSAPPSAASFGATAAIGAVLLLFSVVV